MVDLVTMAILLLDGLPAPRRALPSFRHETLSHSLFSVFVSPRLTNRVRWKNIQSRVKASPKERENERGWIESKNEYISDARIVRGWVFATEVVEAIAAAASKQTEGETWKRERGFSQESRGAKGVGRKVVGWGVVTESDSRIQAKVSWGAIEISWAAPTSYSYSFYHPLFPFLFYSTVHLAHSRFLSFVLATPSHPQTPTPER